MRIIVLGVATVLLAACGVLRQAQDDTQPPIGAPGAMVRSRTIAKHADRGGSWMSPEASGDDLLYVASPSAGSVYVYSPKGKLVGTLTGLFEPLGECVDASGNVFVVTQGSTSSSGSNVYEYAHGGSTPIATLSEPGFGEGCAIDAKTENLAVANIDDANNPYYNAGDIAIFQAAQGNPTMYYIPEGGFVSCSYDDGGNLYLATTGSSRLITLDRLSSGSKTVSVISLNKDVYSGYLFEPSVQWDGSHMTISTVPQVEGRKGSGLLSIYQLQISGSSATVSGTTNLKFKKNRHRGQTWIYGNSVVGGDDWKGGNLSTWSYPNGGRPNATIKVRQIDLWGFAVSPGSHR